MLIFKRNQIVITALIIVIVCAGYLNYKYDKTEQTATNDSPIGSAYFVEKSDDKTSKQDVPVSNEDSNNYFVVTRAEKERTRDEQKEMLQNMINNENVDEKAKEKAQEQLMQMAQNAEKEMIIEGVLKGKGFEDVIAFISDGKIDIIVKGEKEIIPSKKAMILDVVMRKTDISAENIKISPYKKPESEDDSKEESKEESKES